MTSIEQLRVVADEAWRKIATGKGDTPGLALQMRIVYEKMVKTLSDELLAAKTAAFQSDRKAEQYKQGRAELAAELQRIQSTRK